MPLNHFLRDQRGAVMVEVTIMLSLTLVLVLGAIDFLLLFYQWNAAAKAVQMGARLAAVSDPVASGARGCKPIGTTRCRHAEVHRHVRGPYRHLHLQQCPRLPGGEGLR
jgi:Flp pilus assembly pilin Flp